MSRMDDVEPVGGLIRQARRRRQQRRWQAETFPTSLGGAMRAPYPSGAVSPPDTGGESLVGSSPIGELIRLTVDQEHHGPGEPIVFASAVAQTGFRQAALPGAEIELPHTAVYGIEGDLSWIAHDGEPPFTGGGDVHLRLNGTGIPGLSPIRAGGQTGRNLGKTFCLAEEFVASKGDRLSIIVDHADAEPDVQGTVELATKEPLRVTVEIDFEPFFEQYLFSTSTTDTEFTDAGYFHETDLIGGDPVQAGDLAVSHVHILTSSDDGSLAWDSFIPNGDWQLVDTPVVESVPDTGGQVVSYLLWKVLTQADVDSGSLFQGQNQWTKSSGASASGRVAVVDMVFRGPTGVTTVDNQAATPSAPWSTTLDASGTGGLVSVVTCSDVDPTQTATRPDDSSVAVNGWDTWGFESEGFGDVGWNTQQRAQRADSPQDDRSVDVTGGSPSAHSGASAIVFVVA
ncbi:MAG: hypothetical protein ACOC96_05645 [Actinomycetota bacterium]